MEPLAYLYLVQDYENDEHRELTGLKVSGLKNLSSSIASINFKRSIQATTSLLSTASATWMLATPYVALADGYIPQESETPHVSLTDEHSSKGTTAPHVALPEEHSSKEGIPIVVLIGRYVKSYAGGGYYYILQDGDFRNRIAYAVEESSYQPVRPDPVSSQVLCGIFQQGDSGSGVACLQELLQKAGYFEGAITGYFGSKTCDAVIALQRDYGLYADGVAGPQTLEVLNKIAGH